MGGAVPDAPAVGKGAFYGLPGGISLLVHHIQHFQPFEEIQKAVLHRHPVHFPLRQIVKIFSCLNINGKAVQRKSFIQNSRMGNGNQAEGLAGHALLHGLQHMLLVQHQTNGVPIPGGQAAVLFGQPSIILQHLLIRQIPSAHGSHMNPRLIFLAHIVKIQSGITGKHRHLVIFVIGKRLLSGIFQWRGSILRRLRNPTLHIRKAQYFQVQPGQSSAHGFQLRRVSRTI